MRITNVVQHTVPFKFSSRSAYITMSIVNNSLYKNTGQYQRFEVYNRRIGLSILDNITILCFMTMEQKTKNGQQSLSPEKGKPQTYPA